jgi:mycothiol synthase
VRAFAAGDESTLVQINAEAFGGHREAGALDLDEVRRLATQPWFDPEGVFFYPREGEVGAFCWTKVHPNGEGEIYRIGVGARLRGQGVGKAIVEAGFEYLASMRGCRTGFLWVDSANDAAMRLYRSIGMTQRSRNIEFTRKADRT